MNSEAIRGSRAGGVMRSYDIAMERSLRCATLSMERRVKRRFLAAGIAAAAALTACVGNDTYMGISLTSDSANSELQLLASRARAGDKASQLELGIRFEEGRGVERSARKARDLYRLAASDSGGPVWVYIPGVGNETKGRVMQVDESLKISGLDEAKARLDSPSKIRKENRDGLHPSR